MTARIMPLGPVMLDLAGTEISAEPKPVMPRMKYALIRMHRTRTMSATGCSLVLCR